MIITANIPSSSSRNDPPDVLSEGMVGTPEEHVQALHEATTKMLQDSTPERVADIAGYFQGPELVHEVLEKKHNPQEPQDHANEGNDSTQVAAEKDYIWCSPQYFFSLSAGPARALFWAEVMRVAAWFGKHVQACGLVLFSYEPISDCTDPFQTIVN